MKNSFFTLLLVLVFTSCAPIYDSTSYVDSFETFVEELEQREDITPSEFTEIKKDFLDYSETYYNKYASDLTREQEKKVLALKLRYHAAMGANRVDDMMDTLESIGGKAADYINDLLDEQSMDN